MCKKTMRIFFKFLIIAAILGAGAAAAWRLIETRPKPKKRSVSVGAPLVETVEVRPVDERVTVTARGTVVAAREVVVFPQVTGRIVERSTDLVPGGRFAKGGMLLRIDPSDYLIAEDFQKAEVARALVELKMERGRQAIAAREWKLVAPKVAGIAEGRELALRVPHLARAKAALLSAESALKKARYDLARTTLRAPFNAVVIEKRVDVGQSVGPGTRIARLAGTDLFWVRVSVPVEKLPFVTFPDGDEGRGAAAVVIHEGAEEKALVRRDGEVVRLLGDLDPVGRMARVLVAVNDPLGLSAGGNTVPLLLSAYVRVEIEGPELSGVYAIPRKAMREGTAVWRVEDGGEGEGVLAVREVDVAWRDRDLFYVRGLAPGCRLILGRITAPVAGMRVRTER